MIIEFINAIFNYLIHKYFSIFMIVFLFFVIHNFNS